MSKIAEQKALEAYPDTTTYRLDIEDKNKLKREAYIKIYDQAFQDFMEKACKYLTPINYTHPHLIDLDNFKNYMSDEMQEL